MYSLIESGKYENKVTYPTRPKQRCDVCGKNHSDKDAKFCGGCGCKLTYKSKLEVYNLKMKEYRRGDMDAKDLFRVDLLDDLGVPLDHPKAEKLFSLAWEKGHSDGYNDVYGEACELVELLDI